MKLEFKSVRSLYIKRRYVNQYVRHQSTGFFDWLTRGETKDVVRAETLPDLYLDGRKIGTLHRYGPDQAEVVRAHIKSLRGQPVDLVLNCQETSSGFFVSWVRVLTDDKPSATS